MAAINLGYTSSTNPIPQASQQNIIKTSDGILFFAAVVDGYIKYKTSSDNGNTWDGSWTQIINEGGYFDLIIDSSDNIFLLWTTATGAWSVKLTYNSGTHTWSIGSKKTIISTSSINYISGIKRTSGQLLVSIAYRSGSTYRLYYGTSDDDGDTWYAWYITTTNYAYDTRILEVGSTAWCFTVTSDKKLQYHIWDDDEYEWGSANTIESANVNFSTNSLGAIKISDSEIYVAIRKLIASPLSGGIRVYKYDGSWDSGTDLTTSPYDNSPFVSNIGGFAIVTYIKSDGVNYSLVYRKWNGSTWDGEVEIYNSGTTFLGRDSGFSIHDEYLYCGWNDSDNHYIYFDKVQIITTTTIQKTILSDAKVIVLGQKFIISDAEIYAPSSTITSDAKIHVIGVQSSILSDAKVVIGILFDVNNKVNFIKQILDNINNKVNTVLQNLSNINNHINICKSIISNIVNDFRTKKLIINNITNDIRFLYSWQKAANGILQSLGKSYIKVYIGGIEQTDVDVNSISISKELNTAHTAIFDLGRPYDSTKPAMEAIVLIKYHIWTLFSGYITSISPSEDPEKIRINCQDEYWKQNKSNVYYHVGHKPQDNKELYYETLQSALLTEHSWNLKIGNFVPQTLDNFAIGKSDAVTNLIQEIGNYGWFYNIDGIKKLWIAGEGSVIELERQILGENINLYNIINHSFSEDVENIVNKLRVQMGEKVIRKFDSTGGSRPYTGYNYSSFQGFLTPAWGSFYEKRASVSADGYGWDYPEPGYEKEYGEVFKKFNIPYLDTELSSYSDRFPPLVKIYSPGGFFYSPIEEITEGFSIDYENRIITFNEPQFLFQTNNYGELISVRASLLKLFLWKKNYYTFTTDPSQDPETDISNPLMFFTDKMGDYPDTIIKDLNLSNLSIQEGGITIGLNGEEELIPSWDDTDFAKDYANWQLSKTCDKKINGNIEITLDTVCFYNIDLTKRIYIEGITEEPMNIISITYNISNFTVVLTLENSRGYQRTVSIPSHGE